MSSAQSAVDGRSRAAAEASTTPERAGWVLASLILVAAVANLNLAVANVALPDIGEHFDSSQTALDLIAVGYSLGLACSVLWFGALGDRYGRKTMAVGGTILAGPRRSSPNGDEGRSPSRSAKDAHRFAAAPIGTSESAASTRLPLPFLT